MNANAELRYWSSPLEAEFADDAEWADCGDSRIAESFAAEPIAPPVGVCDLSPLPRAGAKGECAAAAPMPNFAAPMPDGSLFCRLGADEVLILSPLSGAAANVDKTAMPSPRIFLPRRDSHCQIGLCGAAADAALSRLCAMPPPRDGALLQTRIADVSAIIVAESRAADGAFYLLTERGYAMHLWREIAAAVAAVGGGIVGWRQWRALFAAAKK